jgi:GH24 family phage-related lysozyme (muramidase)
MKISQKGVDLIKSFEGLSLKAYKVPDADEKFWTIGYGHYGADVKEGSVITKSEAEFMLKWDLKSYEKCVNDNVKVVINQNQFDALVSFCYNVGKGALRTSTLLSKLNKRDFIGASKEFDKWVNAGGKKFSGLVKRRNLEKTLFLKELPIKIAKPKKASLVYTVKSGDTMTGIAIKYNTTVEKIMKLNSNVKDKDKIYRGQKLKIE